LIGLNGYFDIASKALHFRGLRSDLISSNIANIDTPFYKAKDIAFENVLKNEVNNLQNNSQTKLHLAKSSPLHLDIIDESSSKRAEIYLRPNHAQRNDGNSVDLDVETTKMSQNTMMINALTEAMKKRASLLKAVIDTSSRVS